MRIFNKEFIMRRIAGYRCTICGKEFPFGPELMTCPDCGEKGILDILYDYDEVGRELTRESLSACRAFTPRSPATSSTEKPDCASASAA